MSDDILNSLACPHNDQFEDVLNELAICLFSDLIDKAITLKPDDAEVTSLMALKEILIDEPVNHVWIPELGHLLSVPFNSLTSNDFNWFKDQLLLCAHLLGLTEKFEIKKERYRYGLRLGGKIWGVESEVSLEADKKKIFISFEGNRKAYFPRLARKGKLFWYANDERIVPGEAQIRVVNDEIFDPLNGTSAFNKEELNFFTKDVERALNQLKKYSPEYYTWVVSAISEVSFVTVPHGKEVTSSSIFHQFGCVRLSMPASEYQIIDMLVHEASHQYLNLLWSQGRIVEKDAEQLYSPLKGAPRPMHMVTAGYHAFGNVRLMQHKLPKQLQESDQISKVIEKTEHYVRELGAAITDSSKDLTDFGKSLFFPLHYRLVE